MVFSKFAPGSLFCDQIFQEYVQDKVSDCELNLTFLFVEMITKIKVDLQSYNLKLMYYGLGKTRTSKCAPNIYRAYVEGLGFQKYHFQSSVCGQGQS